MCRCCECCARESRRRRRRPRLTGAEHWAIRNSRNVVKCRIKIARREPFGTGFFPSFFYSYFSQRTKRNIRVLLSRGVRAKPIGSLTIIIIIIFLNFKLQIKFRCYRNTGGHYNYIARAYVFIGGPAGLPHAAVLYRRRFQSLIIRRANVSDANTRARARAPIQQLQIIVIIL